MEWISTEDRLPDIKGDYLGLWQDREGKFFVAQCYFSETEGFFPVRMVPMTHWMPLPDLPSVENDLCNCPICDEETRKILDETYHKHAED